MWIERAWRRHRLKMLAAGAAALAIVGLVAANVAGHFFGVTVPSLDPEVLAARLRPHYVIARPDGPGPFPVALLLSGCDGPRDNLDRWSQMLAARGWATVVVDSHTPRNLVEMEKWRLVCAGQVLMGSERAGDILVAMEDARRLPFADPHRLLLLGASHGGWSIMDLLALDPPRALPSNLARLPEGAPADPLDGLAGVILMYPWCGPGNLARHGGWRRPVPTLMVLAGSDSIAPLAPCLAIAEALEARDLPVETLLLPGVDHGFDQSERSALSPLVFDAGATAVAMAAAERFLDGL